MKYEDFQLHFTRLDPVAKPEAFTGFDDEVINLTTYVGKNTLHDIVLFMKGKSDLDSLLSWLKHDPGLKW